MNPSPRTIFIIVILQEDNMSYNNNLKKIVCAVISASAVTTALPAMAALPSDVIGTRYEAPVSVLSALKIMNGDENGAFRLDDTIIRSEVAKMAVHAMGLDSAAASSKGHSSFSDVSDDHWASGYINVASSLNLIIGDGDGNFRPNDTITYAEAMTIMTRATGYEAAAQSRGGYPSGYMSVGTTNGLAKNVQCGVNEKISRGNVAQITANALEVGLMEQTGYGSGASYEVTDKTLLKDKLSVEKHEGVVMAYESSSIDGSADLGKNRVRIGDKTYTTEYPMSDLLGHNVHFYLHSDNKGNESIILATPIASKNSTVKIDDESFSKLTSKNGNTAIEYFTDEAKRKTSTAEIAPDAKLVYNGKQAEFSAELIDLSKFSGSVKLLDSNSDGKYNVAFVTEFTNMVVDKVSSAGRITDKLSGSVLKLDDEVNYTLTLGSSQIDPKELKEWDVLEVSKSLDGSLYNINVTRNSIDGRISGADADGVYIADKHYKAAPECSEKLSVGMEGSFCLDSRGRIVAVNTANRLSSGYAYLLNAYVDNNGSDAYFRVFTKDGKTETIKANDKVKVNGKSGIKAADAVNSFRSNNAPVKQLVTFEVNNAGSLSSITAAKDNSGSGKVDTSAFTLNYKLDNTLYSAKTSKIGNVRIGNDTLILDLTDTSKDCAAVNKDFFEDEQRYSVLVYDMSESLTAGVIVVTGSSVSVSDTAPIAVVKSVSSAVNSNDEQIEKLTVLVNGEEKSFFTKDEGILVKNGAQLTAGDIIQYKTNSNSEIVGVRVLMDINTKNTELAADISDDLSVVYGRVTKNFGSSVNIETGTDGNVNYRLPDELAVSEIDTSAAKTVVSQASSADIHVYDEDEGNRLFLMLYKDEVVGAVIIK